MTMGALLTDGLNAAAVARRSASENSMVSPAIVVQRPGLKICTGLAVVTEAGFVMPPVSGGAGAPVSGRHFGGMNWQARMRPDSGVCASNRAAASSSTGATMRQCL